MANIQQSSVVDSFESLQLRHSSYGSRHAFQAGAARDGVVEAQQSISALPVHGERTYMTEQINFLKAALQNKRSELARSIRSKSSQLNVCEDEHDLIDRMQSMSRRDEAVAFLDTLTGTLASVDAALRAMKEGSYGTCAECDEPIAYRRLEAIPWASHCIRCQEVLDHRKHMGVAVPHWDKAA
jgi:DnaK suppressor protein